MKIVRKALRLNTEILMSSCVDFGLDRFEKAAAHAHNNGLKEMAGEGVNLTFVLLINSCGSLTVCASKPPLL